MKLFSRGVIRGGGAMGAIALLAATAGAGEFRTGVDHLRFAWSPAAGRPLGYVVTVARNGGPWLPHGWVEDTEVEIPVSPGDRVAVAVRAGRGDAPGDFVLGPRSPVSEDVRILRSPQLPVAGRWTLRCAACPRLAVHELSVASRRRAEAQGLPLPWVLVATARLAAGSTQLVWQDPASGRLALWRADTLGPVPGATATGPPRARVVGAADFDADGAEELVLHDGGRDRVELWGLTGDGLERRGGVAGPAGATLAAVADFTGDGGPDLLWQDAARSRLELWRLAAPAGGGALSLAVIHRSLLAAIPASRSVAAVADYDGDGHLDLLWREGSVLGFLYLRSGAVVRGARLPALHGDERQRVVGSLDVDGIPGAEIALQHYDSRALSIAFPAQTGFAARLPVLHPGAGWTALDVRPD